MGLFDGVKDAFTTGNDKPIVSEDRVTPFDRWLGLDKDLTAPEQADSARMEIASCACCGCGAYACG